MSDSSSRQPPSPSNPSGQPLRAEEENSALHPLPPGLISSEQTGLPGLTTWPRVYLMVVFVFVLWVILLSLFMHQFS